MNIQTRQRGLACSRLRDSGGKSLSNFTFNKFPLRILSESLAQAREGALKGQHIILPDTRAEKKEDQLVGSRSSTAINWLGWVANWYIKVKLVSLVHGPRDQTEFLIRAESTFSRQ